MKLVNFAGAWINAEHIVALRDIQLYGQLPKIEMALTKAISCSGGPSATSDTMIISPLIYEYFDNPKAAEKRLEFVLKQLDW